jgi:2'-5' RNA ligase
VPKLFITLILDGKADQQVRQLWDKLAGAGVLDPKAPRHRPHITLSGYEATDIDAYVQCLKQLVPLARPAPIMMHHLGIFPERRVVFLGVRMHERLWNLHQSLLAHFEPLGAPPCSPNFLIDQWTPHCTLAQDLPDDASVAKAIATLIPAWHPIDAKAVGMGLLVKEDATPQKIEDRVQFLFGHKR